MWYLGFEDKTSCKYEQMDGIFWSTTISGQTLEEPCPGNQKGKQTHRKQLWLCNFHKSLINILLTLTVVFIVILRDMLGFIMKILIHIECNELWLFRYTKLIFFLSIWIIWFELNKKWVKICKQIEEIRTRIFIKIDNENLCFVFI